IESHKMKKCLLSEADEVRHRIHDLEQQLSSARRRLAALDTCQKSHSANVRSKPNSRVKVVQDGAGKEPPAAQMHRNRRFIDIAVNFTDSMFRGVYRGKEAHADDRLNVVARSKEQNVVKWLVTGGNLAESQEAIELCRTFNALNTGVRLLCTVGCHPTRASEFESGESTIEGLENIILNDKSLPQGERVVAAVGECGLDYDREEFCPREIQKKWFAEQLQLSKRVALPLFLHNRNTGVDFETMIAEHSEGLPQGCSHSFTGSIAEAKSLMKLGLFIGINGCSLRCGGEGGDSSENLLQSLPLDRIMLETDAPWCDIRPTHPSFKYVVTQFPTVKSEKKYEVGKLVKNRQEPVHILQVFEVVCGMKGIVAESDRDSAASVLFKNADAMYFQPFD
ncbi:Deoxyribonuclease Tat-D, partial [Diplonema papillatum]